MSKALFDSITFRTTAVLVLSLAVTHFVSMLFYTADSETRLLSAGGEHAIQWVATVGEFVETLDTDALNILAEKANTQNRFVNMINAPLVPASASDNWHEVTLQTELARHVDPGDIENYRIAYLMADDVPEKFPSLDRYFSDESGNLSADLILVSLNLGGDKWLNMASPVSSPPLFFSAKLALSMAVMLIAVAVISALLVRKMTNPLRQLSTAAETLGTDVQGPAIPETGSAEVRRTARAFNVMQNRIRRFVEDRTQMLGAIAHDLGTPITRLRLRAEFVDDKSLRRKMLRDLDDMQQMVVSTLAFIKEDTTTEPRVTVDIGSLLARVCDDISDSGFEVKLEEVPRWVLVDCRPVALRRALTNIIDNAVKYGKSARVLVKIQESVLQIMVEDCGPGIAPNRQNDVFRPFLRLEDSRNRNTGGTGLGLSVARTIVRGHGGDIRLENRKDGGLCVEISLPLSATTTTKTEPDSAEETIVSQADRHTTKIIRERGIEWKTL